ncbi:hypothetical protein [Thalassobius sp. I31.1]|uniref:hypothetical protein n=1 Tax=Thalassobius sp. I31.1 TaxID=2109912 RepID=UPI000D1BBD50|nr:hypothetical protein [Thalassobius sp. I31.1]
MLYAMQKGLCSVSAAIVITVMTATCAFAETITITDIAGRVVDVEKNSNKVVLGVGRTIYSVALLDRDNPFQRVTAWPNDMIHYDPDSYRKDLAAFPEIKELPVLGNPYHHEWNLEAVMLSASSSGHRSLA